MGRRNVILKLDMAKVYDRVEWIFLEHMMRTMEFPNHFIQLIMGYITSISYSLLLQGRPFGHIVPSRGLRQGDPLSSYLFLIVEKDDSLLVCDVESLKIMELK
ncbi:unnamed protein product [Prunus armeniaca]|uniref:Reverse transcriptase domain-containing protein n=1 Tax=Prunus armeniaca TaxID=36596 RepID=A0A6J5XRX9_PRUAR|nr:unnamed protein product [Prunus armeniaca]